MCARPVSDKKRTKTPDYRMTKGEVAMIVMKAGIEGVGMSELVRRAVKAYKSTPQSEICAECHQAMSPSTIDWEYPIELVDRKHTLVITNVPAMRCECGETSYNLDVEINMDELVDQLAKDALRYQKEIPERMSIDELFSEEYLGSKGKFEVQH